MNDVEIVTSYLDQRSALAVTELLSIADKRSSNLLNIIPKPVRWILGLVIVAALGYGLWEWTTSMGRDRLIDVAKAQNLCSSVECTEGISQVSALLGTKYDVAPSLIQWCVGVDRWGGTRARKMGWLKGIVVYGMYLPCPSMSEGR